MGAIALSSDATGALVVRLDRYWYSVLYGPYEAYDRTGFIEMLNDWLGPTGMEPDWYAGAWPS
jgi:hypothetical protein